MQICNLQKISYLTILGWFDFPSCLRREISRRTDMGTPSSVRASFTFLMATILSLTRSRALYTVP